MNRIRLFSWLLLFAVTCCIAPAFESTAGAFGRHRQTVCIQYVYVPVYIEKEGTGGAAAVPKVHFFLVMDTLDRKLKADITAAESAIEYLYYRLPQDHRGMLYLVPATDERGLSRSRVLQELGTFGQRARVQPRDTVVVFCNTHGSYTSTDGEKVSYDGGQTLKMWDSSLNADKKKQFPNVTDITAEQMLPRERLLDVLRNQVPGRLKMLITDACYVGEAKRGFDKVEGPRPDDGSGDVPADPDFKALPFPTRDTHRVLTDLFLNHRGLLNVNSASKDEYAVARVFPETFRELALGYKDYRYDLRWNTFLDQLRDRVPLRLRSDLKTDTETRDKLQTNPKQFDPMKRLTQTVYVFADKNPATGAEQQAVPVFARWEDDPQANDGSRKTGGTGGSGGTGTRRSDFPEPALDANVVRAAPAAPTPPPPISANIAVHLPADANLFLEGVPSKQKTDVRYYKTHPLRAGETVSYTFRAEMRVGDRTVSDTKVVTLRGGDDAVVKFDKLLTAAAEQKKPASPATPGVATR